MERFVEQKLVEILLLLEFFVESDPEFVRSQAEAIREVIEGAE